MKLKRGHTKIYTISMHVYDIITIVYFFNDFVESSIAPIAHYVAELNMLRCIRAKH